MKEAILAFLLLTTPAAAHDTWANGDPVPPSVRAACCSVSDAHHLTHSQVHPTEGGYRLEGVQELVPYSDVEPSPDGEWWAFYKNFPGGAQHRYCIFGPPSGV